MYVKKYDSHHLDFSLSAAKEFFCFKGSDVFTILPSGKELQGWKIAVTSKGSPLLIHILDNTPRSFSIPTRSTYVNHHYLLLTLQGLKGFVPGNYLKYYEIDAPDLPQVALAHAIATGLREPQAGVRTTRHSATRHSPSQASATAPHSEKEEMVC